MCIKKYWQAELLFTNTCVYCHQRDITSVFLDSSEKNMQEGAAKEQTGILYPNL